MKVDLSGTVTIDGMHNGAVSVTPKGGDYVQTFTLVLSQFQNMRDHSLLDTAVLL